VASPPGGEPPYVPIRATRWPVRRTPGWLILAGLAVIAVTVVLSLVHRPSTAQRAQDLRGFLQTVNSDIES